MEGRMIRWTFIPMAVALSTACAGRQDGAGPQVVADTPGCGDDVCSDDENVLVCPKDCDTVIDADFGDLASCMSDLTQGELSDTFTIVADVEQSYHEMVACGALTVLIAEEVSLIANQMVENPDDIGTPDGFSWNGEAYVTESATSGTVMDVTFHYGDDFDVGADGEAILYDLFDADNYLVNPRLDVDYLTQELILRYDDRGPLVELLGLGARPDRPIRLGLDDVDVFDGLFGRVKISSTVDVVDEREGGTDVVYTVYKTAQRLSPFLTSARLSWEVETTSADRLEQHMETLSWSVDYSDSGLDGTIDFEVSGTHPYAGSYKYSDATWASIDLSCVD